MVVVVGGVRNFKEVLVMPVKAAWILTLESTDNK